MTKSADAIVYDPDRKLQLVVEVKKTPAPSVEWARQMRRNLLAHALIPNAPYFLLALPDFFYLWKDATSVNDQEAPPDYKIEALAALRPYIEQSNLSLNEISQYGFEFLVTSWLQDLVNFELTRDAVVPELQALFDSGLYETIKNGSVAIEAIA